MKGPTSSSWCPRKWRKKSCKSIDVLFSPFRGTCNLSAIVHDKGRNMPRSVDIPNFGLESTSSCPLYSLQNEFCSQGGYTTMWYRRILCGLSLLLPIVQACIWLSAGWLKTNGNFRLISGGRPWSIVWVRQIWAICEWRCNLVLCWTGVKELLCPSPVS